MSKNTPGPWAVSGGMDGRQGRVIEAYATDGNPIRHLVASAARLIAAAPDLLAACESALPCLENEVAADCPWCNG